MTNHPENPAVRRAARLLALAPALFVILATGTASASAPQQWGESPSVSPLHALLVYGVIPAGLFVLIVLLVYIPSMSRGQSYQPGLAWRNEPEWFGGPRGGVEALDRGEQPTSAGTDSTDPGRGGSSGRW